MIIENLPEKRVPIKRHPKHTILVSNATNQSFVNEPLSQHEESTAYITEKGSWFSSKAFVLVYISEVSPKANVIGSHVIYMNASPMVLQRQ